MGEILQPNKNFEVKETLNFKHSANAGDLIYSLPGIRAACRRFGKKAKILCGFDLTGKYAAEHPLGNRLFTPEMFNTVQPLVEGLAFIESMEHWENQCDVHYNLDEIRYIPEKLGMPHTEIRQWIMMQFPELTGDIGEPWIPPANRKKDVEPYIALNLTQRYRNDEINYSFLDSLGIPVLFLGVPKEHDLAIIQCRKAQYIKTKNYAEVAGVIGNSVLFIGNQSSCFAVAEGMGHPRLLEQDRKATNVIPCTPNGAVFVDQKALEYLVREAIK